MSYLNTSDLVRADSFRARVLVGLVNVAGTVLAENQTEMSTARAEKRTALANNVLRDPEPIVSAFIWPVVSNVTIAQKGLDSSDGELEYQITQVWDIVAGVTNADKAS